jgi:hypothetical protein
MLFASFSPAGRNFGNKMAIGLTSPAGRHMGFAWLEQLVLGRPDGLVEMCEGAELCYRIVMMDVAVLAVQKA